MILQMHRDLMTVLALTPAHRPMKSGKASGIDAIRAEILKANITTAI